MSRGGWAKRRNGGLFASLLASVCLLGTTPAWSQSAAIPSQALPDALAAFAEQTGVSILYNSDVLKGRVSHDVPPGLRPSIALARLLEGSGARFSLTPGGVYVISLEPAPLVQETSAAPVFRRPDEPDVMVVTARRRLEDLRQTPVAVTAFSGSELERMKALEISDFIEYAPGVSMSSDTIFQQLAIRGVGTSLGGNANSYYLDNVPFSGVSVPWNPNVQPFDLERVEVLRGPQGTLFGEGALGGAVRILTRAPDAQVWEGRTEAWSLATEGGSMSHGARGMINMPLIKDLAAFRLVAIKEHRAGWIDSDAARNVNDVDVDTYRARLRVTPTDSLTLDAAYWSNERANEAGAGATDDGFTATGAPASQSYEQISFGARLEDAQGINVSYNFGRNDFSYQRDTSYISDVPYDIGIDLNVETHELLLTQNAPASLSWTAGYFYREAVRFERVTSASRVLDTNDVTVRREHAVFTDLDWTLSDQWSAAAGVRYFTSALRYEAVDPADMPLEDREIRARSAVVLPRFILSHRPREHALVYVSAASGARGGQSQPLSSWVTANLLGLDLPQTLPTDRIWTYELGGKLSLDSGRLQLEGAVYHSIWTDPANRFQLTETESGLIAAGEILMDGVEVSVARSLGQSTRFNAGLSYINARYSEDVPGSLIQAGDVPEMVPQWTASASLDYLRPLDARLYLSGRLDMSYTSRRSNPAYSIFEPGDDIVLANAHIGLETRRYAVRLYARNLGDEGGALYTVTTTTGEASRPRPRSIGLELQGRF